MTAYPLERRSLAVDATIDMVATTDGWSLRTYDRPVDRACDRVRGSILWLGGRGDIFEKYFESFEHWHRRGWHVTSFDWRGQGGSGRLLNNPKIGHIGDFAIWIADLKAFWTDWISQTPEPHVIMGHSMGGHLVLRALTEHAIAPAAAVLSAPMLGFDSGPLPQQLAATAARLLGKLVPHRLAWQDNERPSAGNARRQDFLTRDAGRYDDELWWRDADPSLTMGPPSWGWMAAAYRSGAILAQHGAIEAVTTPILIVGTDGDRLVSPSAIRRAGARLPNVEVHMFDDPVAHEVLREVDMVRDVVLDRIDGFLDRHAPAQ